MYAGDMAGASGASTSSTARIRQHHHSPGRGRHLRDARRRRYLDRANGCEEGHAASTTAPDVSLIASSAARSRSSIRRDRLAGRGHPSITATTPRSFYSVRDKSPYAMLSQSDYDSLVPIKESDLVDIMSDPVGTVVKTADKGWRSTMNLNGAGEKVLADSTTVNNVILFPSFEPNVLGGSGPATLRPSIALTQ